MRVIKKLMWVILIFVAVMLTDIVFSLLVKFGVEISGITVSGYYSWINVFILSFRVLAYVLLIKSVSYCTHKFEGLEHTTEAVTTSTKANIWMICLSAATFLLIITLRHTFNVIESIHWLPINVSSISLGVLTVLATVSYEELVFRKYIHITLKAIHTQEWLIGMMSALLFMMAHPLAKNGLIGWYNLFALGLIFYIVYRKYGILASIACHFGWNYTVTGGNFVNITYLSHMDIQVLVNKSISAIVLSLILILIGGYYGRNRIKGRKTIEIST